MRHTRLADLHSRALGAAPGAALGAALGALGACAGRTAPIPAGMGARVVTPEAVRAVVSVLAADSIEGRGTGTRGSMKAARVIAASFAAAGLEPAGDSGFVQRVPMVVTAAPRDGTASEGRVRLATSFAALDTVPAARRLAGGNVVGILRGSDPTLRDEAILVDAHYDHLGIGTPVAGDSIYNGAADDASGTTAVMLVARALTAGPRPKRSIVFLATTGEEVGLVGTRWYIQHPVWPLARTVGNLEVEMIGRPDPLAGGAGRAWLTGYDRSTLGATLAANGVPLVADPRPAQHFFERSDNIAFAWLGIPAHTLSSFNLHDDYHRPSHEASRIDDAHMARVIDAAVRGVRLMADGAAPQWRSGRQPVAPLQMRAMLGLEP